MNTGFEPPQPPHTPRAWPVGALVRAIADCLQARFNPVSVRGEISGFARAASGHCYFSLKDEQGQLRCAMFRRSAQSLDFAPAEGDLVEVSGRLDVYGPRGDLQLVVETLRRAGQGNLFERFLRLKAELEAEGCFAAERKRRLPPCPQHLGVVTSLGAAALRDVATALARRAPHVEVTVYPASVQGAGAPAELCRALDAAYQQHLATGAPEVVLLVRGGGSLEDLWAFNDPAVVRRLVAAPMPVVCGVGHETDFTLCDFAADVRAATPTAAAELCAPARVDLLSTLDAWDERLRRLVYERLDRQAQRLDGLTQRLGRPAVRLARDRQRLLTLEARLSQALHNAHQRRAAALDRLAERLPRAVHNHTDRQRQRLAQDAQALGLLDPRHVLQRGYAWLVDAQGQAITRTTQTEPGQAVTAHLADGALALTVQQRLTTPP